jgi:16S rRNA (cytidine1402-2'-O)-methyltransferase
LASERRTLVFFEAPHRLSATLTAMSGAFGAERPAVVCRELTKTHEEVVRGTLGSLVEWSEAGVRGEITLVVAGAPVSIENLTPDQLADRVEALIASGIDRKEATAIVAVQCGVPKRVVFDAVVAAKSRTRGRGN